MSPDCHTLTVEPYVAMHCQVPSPLRLSNLLSVFSCFFFGSLPMRCKHYFFLIHLSTSHISCCTEQKQNLLIIQHQFLRRQLLSSLWPTICGRASFVLHDNSCKLVHELDISYRISNPYHSPGVLCLCICSPTTKIVNLLEKTNLCNHVCIAGERNLGLAQN